MREEEEVRKEERCVNEGKIRKGFFFLENYRIFFFFFTELMQRKT